MCLKYKEKNETAVDWKILVSKGSTGDEWISKAMHRQERQQRQTLDRSRRHMTGSTG